MDLESIIQATHIECIDYNDTSSDNLIQLGLNVFQGLVEALQLALSELEV